MSNEKDATKTPRRAPIYFVPKEGLCPGDKACECERSQCRGACPGSVIHNENLPFPDNVIRFLKRLFNKR